MEIINSRKRLIVDRNILGNYWRLQYRVKTKWFGYMWVTVASCPVYFNLSINQAIDYLQSVRDSDKYAINKYYAKNS